MHRNAIAKIVVVLHYCGEYLETFATGGYSLCGLWKDFVVSGYCRLMLSPPGEVPIELRVVSRERCVGE